MGVADPLSGKGKLGDQRQKVLAAIIDYFNGSASCFLIDSPTNNPSTASTDGFRLEILRTE